MEAEEYFQDFLPGMTFEEADRFFTDIEMVDYDNMETHGYYLNVGFPITRDFDPKRVCALGSEPKPRPGSMKIVKVKLG